MMTIITPVEEAKAQRRACLNAQLGVDNQDVLEHLQSIQRGSNICDPKGKRIEVIREPWDWIETDNHGHTHGANVRKEAAVHEAGHCVSAFVVGGLIHAAEKGFNDDWQTRNLLDVFPDLDVCNLRSLAAALVVYYASAVKAVAMKLYEESRLFTEELLSAAVGGFGPGFRIHPRTQWALKEGPYGVGLN